MVQQPPKKLHGISLLLKTVLSGTRTIDFLQKLVWTDLALEQSRVPDFLRETSKTLEHLGFLPAKVGE